MYVNMPDPHPGRCQNLRPSKNRIGQFLRCLGYEGKPHECHFEQEMIVMRDGPIYSGQIVSTQKPEPWKDPTDG